MTTELQVAPKIGVSEHVDEIEKIPEMVAHLYMTESKVALCGQHCETDPHDKMHKAKGIKWTFVPKGTQSCASCGAPICEACFARNS